MRSRAPIIIMVVALVAIITVAGITLNQKNSGTDGQKSADTATHSHDGTKHTDDENTPDSEDAVATDTVTIENFAFTPSVIKVKAGTKVTWTNKDSTPHTVTSQGGASRSFDSGSMGQGETFSFTFTQAGTYEYLCTFHPDMRGKVIVT